jgi:protein TonB
MRAERMSPPAFALAVLLHGLVALSLWWLSQNRSALLENESPIEVTIEQPKPAPPPELREQPKPLPQVIEGLRPPAPIVSDTPTQVPTPTRQAEPLPPQTAARVEPDPAPPPPARPAEPAKPAPAPQANGIHVPPANPLPAPSPLNRTPSQRQAAAIARGAEQPSPSPFVNPADVYNRARASDNYLWEVVRKLRGYQYRANVTVEQGITVVRIVIARDGRLLDVEVVRSSGVPEMDRGVLAGIRGGSPYTPLPPDIQGPSTSFILPLVSVVER